MKGVRVAAFAAAWAIGTMAALCVSSGPAAAQGPAPGAGGGAATSAPAGALRFAIHSFAIAGNTVLGPEEVEDAVYPFLGDDKTLADAEGARAALERRLQARGFLSVLVTLPPQEVKDREVRLEIVEARVGQRRITGATAFLPSGIAAGVPSLTPGRVPNFERVQDELAALQAEAPDLKLTPVVAAGRVPTEIDIEVKVEDRLPLHGHAEANTRQSFNTTRGRVDAALRFDNLWQRRHSASLLWIVSPRETDQSNTLVAGYALPQGRGPEAARWSFSLVSSDSSTPSSLGGATVVRGEQLGLRWRRGVATPVAGLARGLSLGGDFKNNRDRTAVGSGITTGTGSLRYAVLSAGFDESFLSDDGMQTSWDIGLALGPSGINRRAVACNGRPADQFACKRFGAEAGFEVLKFNLSQRLALPFAPRGWALAWRLQGQLAADPLASGEQIGAGGLDSVRGYHEYEQVGDAGFVGSLEVGAPGWALWRGATLNAVAYLDGAILRTHRALPGEVPNARLRSIGLGLRLAAAPGLRAQLDVALPLATTLKADSNGTPQAASGPGSNNELRVDFSLRQNF
jgi:hemolysin activation/secretion protein